ncbi:hypothetical protein FOZ62_001795, partial [Perkinsus olseni]
AYAGSDAILPLIASEPERNLASTTVFQGVAEAAEDPNESGLKVSRRLIEFDRFVANDSLGKLVEEAPLITADWGGIDCTLYGVLFRGVLVHVPMCATLSGVHSVKLFGSVIDKRRGKSFMFRLVPL